MAYTSPYEQLQALIVDDMSVQQSTLRGQLSSLGIGKVDVAGSPDDALRLIRSKPYGLILCDYNLNSKTDGQQLFEHLRDECLLAPDCLFFMVTAESGYASVASATEHHPDAYLIKPITASDIGDRLKLQIDKRQALLPVTQRVQKEDFVGAIDACNRLLAQPGRWTLQLLQLKGQTLLQMGRHDDAVLHYQTVLSSKPQLVWAQLGLARAFKAAGKLDEAKMVARDLLESPEGQKTVAAFDVLAETLEAQGHAELALDVLRDAASIVPSARRHRLMGESAYRNQDLDTAKESFQRVAKLTQNAVTAQPTDKLWLAQTLIDLGDSAEALKLMVEPTGAQRLPTATQALAQSIRAQAMSQTGDLEGAARALARAREALGKAKADFGTLALAKAELLVGDEQRASTLLKAAVSADHENPRIRQLVAKVLTDTGHADQIHEVVDATAEGLQARVRQAKTLFRDSKIDEALVAIEEAVQEHPDNTAVLLQAAQMNCMALRLQKQLKPAVVERVRLYLSRLDKLMPANDRVTQMQRYYRETVASLRTGSAG